MRATFSEGYDQRTDAQLIEAFYKGEDIALSLLAERLRPQLIGLALAGLPRSEVGRHQLAEDFVQDTLIKVATTRDRPLTRWQRGKSSVSTWVGTILKNIIRSHLRTRKNRIRVTSDLWPQSHAECYDWIEQKIVDHRLPEEQRIRSGEDRRQNWLRAIAELPQELHLLITMQLAGKSHRQIASQLGISRSTVTYRIKSATKKLRQMTAA